MNHCFRSIGFVVGLVALLFCSACKPSLGSADPQERRRAVERYVDVPDLLMRIAQSDPDPLVCAAAVEKIHDPALLEQLARNTDGSWGKDFALTRITDQAALARIARAGNYEAVVRVTDDKFLAEIARYAGSSVVRSLAINRLKDDALLKALYEGTGEYDIQRRFILDRRIELRGREAIMRERGADEPAREETPEAAEEAPESEGQGGAETPVAPAE